MGRVIIIIIVVIVLLALLVPLNSFIRAEVTIHGGYVSSDHQYSRYDLTILSPYTLKQVATLSTTSFDMKYEFSTVDYNTLKSVLIYWHEKHGLNRVECYFIDEQKSEFTVEEFLNFMDIRYPDSHPVRLTYEQLEPVKATPTPDHRETPTPVPTFSFREWYNRIVSEDD